MPLTPEQLAKIRAKETATPDALKRNPLNGYTEGWFHVTLNTRGEAPVLGNITGNAEATDASQDAPRCVLTELGRKVEESWKAVPTYYPEVEIDEFKAMPDHVHGLLHLKPTNKVHLGQVIRGFMIGCTHGYWDTLGIAWGNAEQNVGGVPPVGSDRDHTRTDRDYTRTGRDYTRSDRDYTRSDRDHTRTGRDYTHTDRDHTISYRGPSLMVRGYNDVEAIGEDEIEIKRQYIRNNPRKWLITRTAPDCFRIRRNMKSVNWTPERIMLGLCADRFIAADRNRQVEAWRQITTKGCRNSRGIVSATLKFKTLSATAATNGATTATNGAATATNGAATAVATADTTATTAGTTAAASAALTTFPVIELVGNMELLKCPLFPLICHRADAHLFEQQKAAVLKVAREQGGVIVTACVSPKERDIVKLLQQEFLPVIEVMDNGFSEKYKPTGKNFYAVAEGRRLEVSPWEYEYRRREMRPVKDEQGRPVLDAEGKPEMEEVPDITREMCIVMNEMVRMITKKADDWWK